MVRHCLEVPSKPGGKVNQKYPPLTRAENVEFEKLTRKRNRKHCAHPKIKAEIQAGRNRLRRAARLMTKLENLIGKMSN